MDIGKLPPVTAAVAIGPVESAQREHALAISRLFGEQAISAGTARMLCSVAIPAVSWNICWKNNPDPTIKSSSILSPHYNDLIGSTRYNLDSIGSI